MKFILNLMLGFCVCFTISTIICGFAAYFADKKAKKQFDSLYISILGAKPVYHIKIKPIDDKYYTIVFTNDDWIIEENIKEAFDVSLYDEEVSVANQPIRSKNIEYLTKIANSLNTYDECLKYNQMVDIKERKLIDARKANPKGILGVRKTEKVNMREIIIR